MHKCNIEEILHFTCKACSGWWSIATMERYRPRNIRCPHCGEISVITYDDGRLVSNVVKDTGTIKGRGVFAGRAYRKDDIVEVSPVMVFKGTFDTIPEGIRRIVFDWDILPGTYGIALGQGTLFNHANPANLIYQADRSKLQLTFVAANDISINEELTINYNSNSGESEWHDNNWFERMNINPI